MELFTAALSSVENFSYIFIKQCFQDVKLGLWTLPKCSFWHYLPHTPGHSNQCAALMDKPALSVEHHKYFYWPGVSNFFIIGGTS